MISTQKQLQCEEQIIPSLCSHCDNTECSAIASLNIQFQPIYVEEDPTTTTTHTTTSTINQKKNIDINILVTKLPQDILIKIYNEYIRPHKFAQLFDIFTVDTIYNDPRLYALNRIEFMKHFKFFVYTPILKYIMRIDKVFNNLIHSLPKRNFKSCFERIPNVSAGIHLEILFRKYH